MSLSTEFVTQILEAGGCVDLSNVHSGYPPASVAEWVQIAARMGGHVTVGIGYEHAHYQEWAKLGGRHLTVRL
jgi:hypothetical protein